MKSALAPLSSLSPPFSLALKQTYLIPGSEGTSVTCPEDTHEGLVSASREPLVSPNMGFTQDTALQGPGPDVTIKDGPSADHHTYAEPSISTLSFRFKSQF